MVVNGDDLYDLISCSSPVGIGIGIRIVIAIDLIWFDLILWYMFVSWLWYIESLGIELNCLNTKILYGYDN